MIRKYEEKDLDQLIEAWYESSLVSTPFLTADFLENERGQIRDLWLPMAETWVYEAENRVQGFIALIGNEVGGLFVAPWAQKKGIGRALMDYAFSIRTELVLDVFEQNDLARRFYDRYGFKQISRHIHDQTQLPQLRLQLKK